MHRRVPHPARATDQLSYARRRPQPVAIPERFRPALQPILDSLPIGVAQLRLPARTPGTLQPRTAFRLPLLPPSPHGLSMHPEPPRHFRWPGPLLEQPRGRKPPLFERPKVPFHSRWVSHARTLHPKPSQCNYIM